MADTVRGIMEAMVPELEDYVARGYFSNSEVSSIIQNRQKFEYCLRRRNADKQDFLRCGKPRSAGALCGQGLHNGSMAMTCMYL